MPTVPTENAWLEGGGEPGPRALPAPLKPTPSAEQSAQVVPPLAKPKKVVKAPRKAPAELVPFGGVKVPGDPGYVPPAKRKKQDPAEPKAMETTETITIDLTGPGRDPADNVDPRPQEPGTAQSQPKPAKKGKRGTVEGQEVERNVEDLKTLNDEFDRVSNALDNDAIDQQKRVAALKMQKGPPWGVWFKSNPVASHHRFLLDHISGFLGGQGPPEYQALIRKIRRKESSTDKITFDDFSRKYNTLKEKVVAIWNSWFNPGQGGRWTTRKVAGVGTNDAYTPMRIDIIKRLQSLQLHYEGERPWAVINIMSAKDRARAIGLQLTNFIRARK